MGEWRYDSYQWRGPADPGESRLCADRTHLEIWRCLGAYAASLAKTIARIQRLDLAGTRSVGLFVCNWRRLGEVAGSWYDRGLAGLSGHTVELCARGEPRGRA